MVSNVLAAKITASPAVEETAPRVEPPLFARSRISIDVLRGSMAILETIALLSAGLASAYVTDVISGDRQIVGLIVALGTMLAINTLYFSGAYHLETLGRFKDGILRVVFGLSASAATLIALAAIAAVPSPALIAWLPLWFAGGFLVLGAGRATIRARVAAWRRTGRLGDNIAIIGAGPIAQQLIFSLTSVTDRSCRIAGVFDDRRSRIQSHCAGHRIMGTIEDLLWEIRGGYVDTVVIALPLSADRRIGEILNRLGTVAVDVRLCPDQFGLQLGRLDVSHLGGSSVLNVLDRPLRNWRQVAKLVEDRVLASLILLMISPLMLAIALAIKLDSPGPVFFRQRRWGYNNQLIDVLKFRTMRHDLTDHDGKRSITRDDPRVTKLGAFLRRTSLDELPQFLNVLKGEMSIVGPRPHALASTAGGLLFQDAVRFYDARHRMKPGITGWAQVNGWRGETRTVEQIVRRVEHDLYYVQNWSILMDLKIILRTALGGFMGPLAY